VSEVGIGDRISSEISNPSELVESSIADDEEVDPKPPGSLLRGVQTATTTEHSGLFALEYSEGTIERLRSPFHVSNSGLLDLQEASLAVDISGIRFNAPSDVQFDSHADDVPFGPALRRPGSRSPSEDGDDVARTIREEVDEEEDRQSNRNVSRSQLRELFKKHLAKNASEASEVEASPVIPAPDDAPVVETEASLPEEYKIDESLSSSSQEAPGSESEPEEEDDLAAKSTPLFQRSEAILEAVEASQASEIENEGEEPSAEAEAEVVPDEEPAEEQPEAREEEPAEEQDDEAVTPESVAEVIPPESEVSLASTSFAPIEQAPEESESLANETEIDISVLGK
jgi:hypothetical protein